MPLESGASIGPYTVIAKLGEGGMGEVYRARDSKLKREVALKVLPADVAGDRERLARFQREAEVLAALNHPNIATVHGLEDSALVMELVEGEDLAQRIARGAIPLDETIAIAKQIAEALEAAHEQGIIHRDLKPANVKVRPDGTVKVLDFGLAKALERLESDGFSRRQEEDAKASSLQTITSPAMTMRGVILGTAAYMSPEQARGKPVDKRTDIWAFGCVLYEMLTGARAYEGEDVTDTIAAVVTKEPDWTRLPASTPSGVRRLLARCLTKDRKRRLRDIGDAQHELADEAQAAVAPPPSRAPRAAWMSTAAAALAAALLAIPAISHYRETVAPPSAMRLTIDGPANSVRLLGPEISPDGRAIGFASIAAGSAAPQLWIRRLDEPAPVPAPGPIFVNGSHFWSPDSRAIAAHTRDGLIHLDLATGGTRILAPTRSTMVGLSQFSGTWGPDGVILYGLGGTIHRVSEHGGDSRPLELEGLATDAEPRFPVFLPDGRRFLFLAREQGRSYTYAASIDGGAVTRLFLSDSQAVYTEPVPGRGHVVYVRDDDLMAQPFDLATLTNGGTPSVLATGVPLFTAEFVGTGRASFTVSPGGVLVYSSRSETVLQRLIWINREGKEVGTVGDPALYFGPRISPDGTRVAVARLDAKTRLGDIHVLAEGGGNQRLTFDEANDLQPVWTPDGQYVIWGSQRGSTSMLVRKRADGSGVEEILHQSEHPLAPDDVSSDGRHMVFRESHPKTRNDLWILPLDGSGKARALLNTPADEPRARFSPDGRLIGYISDASGRVEAYLQPFPDMNGKWQVTEEGGQVPQWRRDGRELYYFAASKLWSRPVVGLNPLQLGLPVELFTPPPTPRGSFFHATADGSRFLFAPERFSADSMKYHIALGWMKP